MPAKDTFTIWNNKGGVGKSTITFHLAARYAEQNPDVNVLVIDLCPQANASMMLLGGGTTGEEEVFNRCQGETPRTVVGYLASVIAAGSGAPLPNPNDWIINAGDINNNLTNNLFLLCGDGNLEPMAPLIADRASQPPLTADSDPWLWVHTVFKRFVDGLPEEGGEWVVFIDTNPSFSIYTELAITSADKLVVPVNADDSSRVAVHAMFTLMHGSNPPHPVYGRYTFATKAKERNMELPKVHLIIGNRVTIYNGPAKAFRAMSDATAEALYESFKADNNRFTNFNYGIETIEDFREAYSQSLRDFNSAGVVAAHRGVPVHRLTEGTHSVHDEDIQLDAGRIGDCLAAIDAVLNRLLTEEGEEEVVLA